MERNEMAVWGLSAALLYALVSALGMTASERTQGLVASDTPATMSDTAGLVASTFAVIDTIALVAIALGVGTYIGRQLTLEQQYRDYLLAVGAGSSVGAAAGMVITHSLVGQSSVFGQFSTVLLGNAISQIISMALILTFISFAGAALTQFRDGHAGA